MEQSYFEMFRNIPSVVLYHYREGNINWIMSTYSLLTHTLALVGLFKLPYASKETLLLAYVLWPVTMIGTTVGVHRLWSHRSYQAGFCTRVFFMLCNCVSNQDSIYHWARDHRVHHKHSETDADPHNAKRGFFFAHIGWLLLKKHPDVRKAGKDIDFSDLLDDPVVRFQHKVLDPWFAQYMCFVLPAQIASWGWGEDFWTAFFVAGGLRYICVLHVTFLVNSAAHLYGDHPYDAASHPAENPIVSFLTGGEGWHNWHHKHPYDYAASEFGISSQFNPSKLFIDALAAVGLVWGRKRATEAWKAGRQRRDRQAAAAKKMAAKESAPLVVDDVQLLQKKKFEFDYQEEKKEN